MDQLLQHGLNALMLGGTYALLGIGLTLIFGIMRVVNFTHGELYAFGAYMMYMLVMLLGANFFVALVLAVLLGVVLGAVLEFVLLRRLRGADIDTTMLVMIGAWIALQNAEQLAWTGVAKSIDNPFPSAPLVIGPVSVSWNRVFVFVVALVLIAGDLRAHQPHQARQGDARDLPGPRHRGADGRPDRHHPHRDLRARLGTRRGRRRAARTGVRRLSDHGRSRRRQGLRHRHPRRPGQHRGRDRRRLHPGLGGGTRRGLHLLGLSRRDGLPAHHR